MALIVGFLNERVCAAIIKSLCQRLRAPLILIESKDCTRQERSIIVRVHLVTLYIPIASQVELNPAVGVAATALDVEHLQRVIFAIV